MMIFIRNMKTIKFAMFFFFAAQFAASAASSRPDPCMELVHRESHSVKELVEQADYIGLYEVLQEDKDKVSIYKKDNSHSYSLSILRALKGSAPAAPHISGQEPLSTIPQDYFILDIQHGEIPEEDPEHFGRSELLVSSDGKACLVAPRFVIGYKYLIFGGLNSSLAFEPIHHVSDPWYQRVLSEINAE